MHVINLGAYSKLQVGGSDPGLVEELRRVMVLVLVARAGLICCCAEWTTAQVVPKVS